MERTVKTTERGGKDGSVSNELSFYPYFPADFDSSTRHLTPEQVGVYQRLLNWSWLNGTLPKDPLALQNIAGPTHQPWADLWPAIKSKFKENGHGLINGRLEEERVKVRDRREKAKTAAEARWAKERENAAAGATSDANAGAPAMPSKSKVVPKSQSSSKTDRPPTPHQLRVQAVVDAIDPKFPPGRAAKVIKLWDESCPQASLVDTIAAVRERYPNHAPNYWMQVVESARKNGGKMPHGKAPKDARREEGTDETRRRQLEALS